MTIISQGSLADDNVVPMDPLFEQLLDERFASAVEAFDFCKEACSEYGFPINQEPNMNRNIYVCCTYVKQQLEETDSPASTKQTSSECQWKVVLSENENNEWAFRRSLNPMASGHNHALPPSKEQAEWPQKIQDKIIELAHQKDLSSNRIRELIKMQFTDDVTWSNRLFYNYLMKERGKIRQQATADRVQRLITATTRLCSVVAANEDWAACVEGDLSKLLQNYKHLSGTPGSLLEGMVDLQMNMIYSEIETRSRRQQSKNDDDDGGPLKPKKRKASSSVSTFANNRKSNSIKLLQEKGFHAMTIPSCTLFVRSQQLRSVSDTPIHGNSAGSGRRQAFFDMVVQGQQPMPPYPQLISTSNIATSATPFSVNSVFHLTSPISSSSSTSSTQQRMDYNAQMTYRSQSVSLANGGAVTSANNDMFHSPSITDSNSMIITPSYDSTITSNGSSCGNTNTIASQQSNQYSGMYALNPYSSYPPHTQHQSQQMHFTGSSGNAPDDIDYHFNTTNSIMNSTTTAATPSYAQASQSTAAVAAAAAAAVAVHQQQRRDQQSSSNMASTNSSTNRLGSCYSSNTDSATAAASLEYFSAIPRDNSATSGTISSQRFLYQPQGYDQTMLESHPLHLHSRATANHNMTNLLDAAAATTANRLHHNHSFLQSHPSATALSHQVHPTQSWT